LHAVVPKSKAQTHPLRDEAQLNCVALRSSLDYEQAWKAVKREDERPKTAPLTAFHATLEVAATSEKEIITKEGRHVGLYFYDLLIEALIDATMSEIATLATINRRLLAT